MRHGLLKKKLCNDMLFQVVLCYFAKEDMLLFDESLLLFYKSYCCGVS